MIAWTTVIVAVVALALASVPFAWLVRTRGARRDRASEGRIDGLLLLSTLMLGVFAIAMATLALVRAAGEARDVRASRPVQARVERCWIGTVPGSRAGGPTYTLECALSHGAGIRQAVDTVRTGYIGSRTAYEAWVTAHPPGSTLALRQALRAPHRLLGFEHVAPSTRTGARAAGRAFGFALVALLAFLLSRFLARQRRRAT